MVDYKKPDKDTIKDEESHAVKTGIAGLSGAITGGAAAGMAGAGPLGGIVGAVVGGVAAGIAGKKLADATDHTHDESYWKQNYQTRPDVSTESEYLHYEPAYRYGAEAHEKHQERDFDKVKDTLKEGWDKARGESPLTWDKAEGPVRDAYERRIQLREEHLRAQKSEVEGGDVNLHKEVVTRKESLDVPLEHEELVITRRAVSSDQNVAGEIGEEEIRIPLREEQVRVTKESVIREEIGIKKRKVQETQHIEDTVRSEELRIDEKDQRIKREDMKKEKEPI